MRQLRHIACLVKLGGIDFIYALSLDLPSLARSVHSDWRRETHIAVLGLDGNHSFAFIYNPSLHKRLVYIVHPHISLAGKVILALDVIDTRKPAVSLVRLDKFGRKGCRVRARAIARRGRVVAQGACPCPTGPIAGL